MLAGCDYYKLNNMPAFAKALTDNDIGATGGHQAGPLIPKQYIDFFPALDETQQNPRAEVRLLVDGSFYRDGHFIHYNNRKFGGTRDEYRVTPVDCAALGAKTGDFLVFRQISNREFDLALVPAGSAQADELALPPAAQPGTTTEVAEDAARDLSEAHVHINNGDFTVPDAWGSAKVRRYQSVFRSIVLGNFGGVCCLPECIVDDVRFLDATQITPWKADPVARLDPGNGLLLCKSHHAALDQGIICLTAESADFLIQVSRHLGVSLYLTEKIATLQGKAIKRPQRYPIKAKYADFHRAEVFLR